MKINPLILFNLLLIIIVIYFSYHLVFDVRPWIFFDYLNLVIHEAGHLLFTPFGQFINILGGSLLQIITPTIFFVYFLLKKDYFSSSFIIFWVADNVINVSIYMKDAKLMQLPLLGGDNVIHDWNWLFSSMRILEQSELVGSFFHTLGILLLILSILGMFIFTFFKVSFERPHLE